MDILHPLKSVDWKRNKISSHARACMISMHGAGATFGLMINQAGRQAKLSAFGFVSAFHEITPSVCTRGSLTSHSCPVWSSAAQISEREPRSCR
jgi:hypothetical protein